MKKTLLATTAFTAASVAASGAMAQSLEDRIRTLEESMLMGAPGTGFDVVVSGFAHGGFIINDADPTEDDDGNVADYAGTDVRMGEAEVIFTASSVLDNGIEISGHVQLEGFTSDDQIDETYIQVQGGFGRFLLGSENDATGLSHFSAPWLGLNGAAGAAYRYTATTAVRTGTGTDIAGDATKITYFTPRFSGFQFGISYTPDNENRDGDSGGGGARNTNIDAVENIVGVSGQFTRSFGEVAIGASAGWESGSSNVAVSTEGGRRTTVSNDPVNWNIGGEVSMGGFTVGGGYLRAEGFGGGDGKNSVFTLNLVDGEGEPLGMNPGYNADAEISDSDMPFIPDNGMTSWEQHSQKWDASNRLEQTAWAVGARYETGPWGVGIGYFQSEGSGYLGSDNFSNADGTVSSVSAVEAETSVVGITAYYEAGPGVTIAADLGFYEDDDGKGGDYSTVESVGGGILLGINF